MTAILLHHLIVMPIVNVMIPPERMVIGNRVHARLSRAARGPDLAVSRNGLRGHGERVEDVGVDFQERNASLKGQPTKKHHTFLLRDVFLRGPLSA